MIQSLKETIILTASYYGQTMSSGILNMYVDDLSDLPIDEVIRAYQTYRREPKNTRAPMPAQIRAIVLPGNDIESKAREIAAKINTAVVRIGYNRRDDAKAFIGEDGWQVVELNGGWNHLCTNLGVAIDINSFQAQARELAKVVLAKKSVVRPNHLQIAPAPKRIEIQGTTGESTAEMTVEKLREMLAKAGNLGVENPEADA